MKHLQTYELSRQEHASLRSHPFVLRIPPSAETQEITLTVEAPKRSNGHVASMDSDGIRCDKCDKTHTVTGKPFTTQTLAAHKFKAHNVKANGRRARKGGVK